MGFEEQDIKRGYRKAWLVVLLGVVYIVGFSYLAWVVNARPTPVSWEMGGTPFVPASAPHAEGYYVEPLPQPPPPAPLPEKPLPLPGAPAAGDER